MNYQEALQYLEKGDRTGGRLGLDKLREFLEYLGSPEQKIPTIHVAGTNGKGSVCAYSAYILASSGKRVGLFSSPFVYDFGERIRVLDGRDHEKKWQEDPSVTYIQEEQVVYYVEIIQETIRALNISQEYLPIHFEMLTIMAFMHFQAMDCDVIVLETGLGGRLDSTNVIPAPEVAVITTIGLDHIHRLGNTHLEIAGEKAGILKTGTKAFLLYDQSTSLENAETVSQLHDFFARRATELSIPFYMHAREETTPISRSLLGQSFSIHQVGDFHTKLLPLYEIQNASLAIMAVRAYDPNISLENLQEGVLQCYWPARLEKILDKPLAFLDGGHNPQGAMALRESLNQLLPDGMEEIHIIGIMQDKDQIGMLRNIFRGGNVTRVYCTKPWGNRATPADELAALVREAAHEILGNHLPEIHIAHDFSLACEEAYQEASTLNKVIVCWGTFYQAKAFRDTILELKNKTLKEHTRCDT